MNPAPEPSPKSKSKPKSDPMRTYLLQLNTAIFTMKGRNGFAAKQHAAALLNVSPRSLVIVNRYF